MVHVPLVDSGIGKLIYIVSRSKYPGNWVHTSNDDKLVTCSAGDWAHVRGIFRSGKHDHLILGTAFSVGTRPSEWVEENPTYLVDIKKVAPNTPL